MRFASQRMPRGSVTLVTAISEVCMKFTEYLVFAALLIPTAALLTAAVISLAADNAAPDAQLYSSSVVAAYWALSIPEEQP